MQLLNYVIWSNSLFIWPIKLALREAKEKARHGITQPPDTALVAEKDLMDSAM